MALDAALKLYLPSPSMPSLSLSETKRDKIQLCPHLSKTGVSDHRESNFWLQPISFPLQLSPLGPPPVGGGGWITITSQEPQLLR